MWCDSGIVRGYPQRRKYNRYAETLYENTNNTYVVIQGTFYLRQRVEKKKRALESGKEKGLVRETVGLVGLGVKGAVWLVGAGLKAARASAR